jgi:hypothetical protein
VRPLNGKVEKKLGPMPIMWEAEMYKDEIEEDGSRRASMIGGGKDLTRVTEKEVGSDQADDWRDLTVCLSVKVVLTSRPTQTEYAARRNDSLPDRRT